LYTSPRRVDDAVWFTIHFLFTIRPYNAERLNINVEAYIRKDGWFRVAHSVKMKFDQLVDVDRFSNNFHHP
jgi:hypothetical protein